MISHQGGPISTVSLNTRTERTERSSVAATMDLSAIANHAVAIAVVENGKELVKYLALAAAGALAGVRLVRLTQIDVIEEVTSRLEKHGGAWSSEKIFEHRGYRLGGVCVLLRPAFVMAVVHTEREEGRSITIGIDLVCSERGRKLLLENVGNDAEDGGIILDWIVRNPNSWYGYEESPGVRLRKDIRLKPGTFQERLAVRIVSHYLERRSFCGYIYGEANTGKSMVAILVAHMLNGIYCSKYDPASTQDRIQNIIKVARPTRSRPLVIGVNEIDEILKNIMTDKEVLVQGESQPELKNKGDFNQLTDDLQIVESNVLLLFTGNTSAKEVQELDGPHGSLLRSGRMVCYELQREPEGNGRCSSHALDDDDFVVVEDCLGHGLERSDSAKC